MGIFERYLSVWVGLSIVLGVVLGLWQPDAFQVIANFEIAHVNIVVAVFIWVMIYPMMVQIDFSAIKDVGKNPKGLVLTIVINWLVKPFTMAGLGWFFFTFLFADLVDPAVLTPTVKSHQTRFLAFLHGFLIHITQHQNFASLIILDYRGNQPTVLREI